MKTVWKYEIPIDGRSHPFDVPKDCELAHVGIQGPGYVTIWLVVDPDIPYQRLHLCVFGTGTPIPDEWEHLGTVQDGQLVWHVFEQLYYLVPPHEPNENQPH